jgi:hypothetical protein
VPRKLWRKLLHARIVIFLAYVVARLGLHVKGRCHFESSKSFSCCLGLRKALGRPWHAPCKRREETTARVGVACTSTASEPQLSKQTHLSVGTLRPYISTLRGCTRPTQVKSISLLKTESPTAVRNPRAVPVGLVEAFRKARKYKLKIEN